MNLWAMEIAFSIPQGFFWILLGIPVGIVMAVLFLAWRMKDFRLF